MDTTPWPLYAQVAGSGRVLVQSFETEAERRRGYQRALRQLNEGGYSEDVQGFTADDAPPVDWSHVQQVTLPGIGS